MFAGLRGNVDANVMWDTPNRELSVFSGRWLSTDPAGLGAADPTNPQTWNRYAYVMNNPLAYIDPSGLFGSCPLGSGPNQQNADGSWGCGPAQNCQVGEEAVIWGSWTFCGPQWLPQYLSNVQCSPPLNCGQGGGGGGGGGGAANNLNPADAATQYCQDHGQVAFNIPFTNIPVTMSLSTTAGPANYSATNDINAVVPAFPWPEWLAFGVSLDITIGAPQNPAPNISVGSGKNLSIGTFVPAPGRVQGLSVSVGPSIGPPVNISVPAGNACGVCVSKHG